MCTAGDNLFEICHSSSCEDLWTNNNQQSSTRHEDTTGTCAEWQFGRCDGAYLTRSSAHLRGPSQKLLREMIGKFALWLMCCAVVFVIRRQQLCEMKIDKCLKWLWDNLMNKWMCTPHDEWQSAGRQSWQLQCKSQIMALSNVLRFHFDDPASQQKYIFKYNFKKHPSLPFSTTPNSGIHGNSGSTRRYRSAETLQAFSFRMLVRYRTTSIRNVQNIGIIYLF